ncbi:hypothetical protein K0M31_002504 [Melipona bicolor]|uniref:Uncharacterized protein n=1 Tax=Melipona bicolor TaxID=60889 RepID=A0AA40GHM7_9HYME|nr:hypothetical protein K0M31_002504 [Melipona bicolor]
MIYFRVLTVPQFSENRELFETGNGQTPCYDLTQKTAVWSFQQHHQITLPAARKSQLPKGGKNYELEIATPDCSHSYTYIS